MAGKAKKKSKRDEAWEEFVAEARSPNAPTKKERESARWGMQMSTLGYRKRPDDRYVMAEYGEGNGYQTDVRIFNDKRDATEEYARYIMDSRLGRYGYAKNGIPYVKPVPKGKWVVAYGRPWAEFDDDRVEYSRATASKILIFDTEKDAKAFADGYQIGWNDPYSYFGGRKDSGSSGKIGEQGFSDGREDRINAEHLEGGFPHASVRVVQVQHPKKAPAKRMPSKRR